MIDTPTTALTYDPTTDDATDPALTELLAARLADTHAGRLLAGHRVAVQLAVAWGGRRRSSTLGIDAWGGPTTTATVHNVFCTAKPLLWAVLLRALDDSGLGMTTGVRDVLRRQDWAWVPDVDVATLLAHDAGLGEPGALHWMVTEPEDRPDLLGRTEWQGPASAYSEVTAGCVAERMVEALSGWPSVGEAFDRDVFPAWGFRHSRAVAPAIPVLAPPLGLSVPVGVSSGRRAPLLSQALPPTVAHVGPANGCFASADDLCRFFELALAVLDGDDVPFMPGTEVAREAWTCPAVARDDLTLRRPVAFTGGMMRGIAERLGVAGVSPSAFGHTGGNCTSLAFADPDSGLALGFVAGVLLPDQGLYDEIMQAVIGTATSFVNDIQGAR